ncbi:MAG: dTDP-4-dehydrorhamnose 3,5-epimerase [Reichenbachiella sp.]|uniref:dTDP-4-dehydrorhamnose 3,5-epimerase n=1 Tax=Reichenbachiella sp. TaxID=2184521 RepID=UPI003265439C
MKIEALALQGAYEIEPTLHKDNRGYFFEWFNQQAFSKQTGTNFTPVQFNCSKSTKGVLRGMHFQSSSYSQAKLITATRGEIQDVIIDLRAQSPTYGKHFSTILTENKKNQLFIPKGFAHGFLVLSEEAEIFYAVDNFYAPEHEGGICHNDPDINIKWQLDQNDILLSERDKTYSAFQGAQFNF